MLPIYKKLQGSEEEIAGIILLQLNPPDNLNGLVEDELDNLHMATNYLDSHNLTNLSIGEVQEKLVSKDFNSRINDSGSYDYTNPYSRYTMMEMMIGKSIKKVGFLADFFYGLIFLFITPAVQIIFLG